jgi:hypothetical protein
MDRAADHGRHRRRAPRGQVWVLPEDKLVQLIIGLSSLVASTPWSAATISARAGSIEPADFCRYRCVINVDFSNP